MDNLLTPEEERVLAVARRKLQLQSGAASQDPVSLPLPVPSPGRRRKVSAGRGDMQQHHGRTGETAGKTGPSANAPREEDTDWINKCMIIVLTALSWITVLLTLPLSLTFCLKIVQEYERAVIFRLGKLVSGGARGPGLFFILPCIDSYRSIDLRVVSYDVPPQEILSKDSVTVTVDAVIYFCTVDPVISVTNVSDAYLSTKLLTQTTLRNVLGTNTLSEMLSDRERIANQIQVVLDEGTEPWGIKVERVEVKDIRLPPSLMRAMAAEAEATREAKAKVIAAQGEERASEALRSASDILTQSPAALQLRYLQTLSSIAAEHNSTVIFPVPLALFAALENSVTNTLNSGQHTDPKMQVPQVHQMGHNLAGAIGGLLQRKQPPPPPVRDQQMELPKMSNGKDSQNNVKNGAPGLSSVNVDCQL